MSAPRGDKITVAWPDNQGDLEHIDPRWREAAEFVFLPVSSSWFLRLGAVYARKKFMRYRQMVA